MKQRARARHGRVVTALAVVAVSSVCFFLAGAATGCSGVPRNNDVPAEALPPADAGAREGGACSEAAYPATNAGLDLFLTVPDLTFDGLDRDGHAAPFTFRSQYLPCATEARLLVVRVGAAWCGTCRWSMGHTRELFNLDVGSRLELVDLVVGDDDNAPPTPAALDAFRARVDAPRFVAADSAFTFRVVNPQRSPLPMILLVDRRTMRIEGVENDPTLDSLAYRIHSVIAAIDGTPKPRGGAEPRTDGRFTRNQWDMIRDIAAPGAPPPDPTNAKADDPAAAALGEALFADAKLSPSGNVSCATCHAKATGFADGRPQSLGVTTGDRNAPSVALASHARAQFWDGRADSLWMQATGPLENPAEFKSSRLFVAHRIATTPAYKTAYEAVFGPLPNLADAARFPASGKPGDAAYDAMADADRAAVTRVFANCGKSIAAFERTLRVSPNALDRYASGDFAALSDLEKDGLLAFFRAGCAQCHYGPRLTDDAFHAIAFPTGRQDHAPDRGRADGILSFLASELSSEGPYSDAPLAHVFARDVLRASAAAPVTLGAFKTPTLRGLPSTAPYGHGGTFATLAEVVKHYAQAGSDASRASYVGEPEPWLVKFDDATRDAVTRFLPVLTAEAAPSR